MSTKQPETGTRPGTVLFVAIFLLISVFLASRIGTETKFSASGKLFAQPRFWPAVGAFGMVFFGICHLIGSVVSRPVAKPSNASVDFSITAELFNWLRAVEYLIWFMVYVWVVPIIGYLPATLLFTPLLAFRLGYRQKKPLVMAVLLGFAIVLVFKTGLSVKIPGGQVYEWLPDQIRNFMIINF